MHGLIKPNAASPLLPPTIKALGWTSFLTDLSSEAIYPLLPTFLLRELGGSTLFIGLIDGLATALAAIVRLPSGALSDRFGRRRLVLFGYGLSAVIRPLMGLVATPFEALLVRASDRIGKGIRGAPRDALVTDLVQPAIRGRAFGHIRALDHAGAALGPVVAMLFLLFFPGEERRLFLLTILPGLLTLAVLYRLVHDPSPRLPPPARTSVPVRLSRQQSLLLWSVGIWALGASSEQFLLLRVADLGVPLVLIPLVWLGMSLAKSGAALAAGRLADHWHPRRALATGWLVFAAAYGGLAVCTETMTAVAVAMVMLVGVAYGMIEPAERSLVALLSPAGHHGGAFGWYALVQGLLALPAGLLTGWLWQQGPHGVTWALALTAVLSTVACLFLTRPLVATGERPVSATPRTSHRPEERRTR
ncbi:MAG: MFS transporter [Planctomycetaceae bacterium]|nr:MAG: MFS transporter [Planctomycetaceae bacterium]